MNENDNKESEMDYSQKNLPSIRSSKSKKEKLAKFLKEHNINSTDVMEVALTIIEEEIKETKSEIDDSEKKETKKTWSDLEIKDNKDVGTLSHSITDDIPNVDIYKCAMVAQLDMMNMSGLLDKEEQQELKLLNGEVLREKMALEEYWERSFREKKSDCSRR